MDLGFKIKKIRELKGFSQKGMGELLSISQKQYSRIENNQISPSFELVESVCESFNISLQELLEFDSTNFFNNYNSNQTGGDFTAYNNTEIKQIESLYKSMISEMKEEILFLRNQLKK